MALDRHGRKVATSSGSAHDLEPGHRQDLALANALLRQFGLGAIDEPTEIERLIVARDGQRLVGTVALEAHPPHGLLRSLAVAPDHRGRGLGRALVARLLEVVASTGLRSVYLLTVDAADFFRSLGFAPVDRDEVPESICATKQYRSECPSSAVVLRIEVHPGEHRDDE